MFAMRIGALSFVALLAACGAQGQGQGPESPGSPAAPALASASAAASQAAAASVSQPGVIPASQASLAPPGKAAVTGARIIAADSEPGNWMTYGRTYDEQRFSPLKQINAQNVGQLHLAWHYDLAAAHRAQESTPIVVDGVMYVTSAWSKVFALDPATGKELWVFDPAVPGTAGVKGCCDVGNRGVAVWNGRVYVGTFDGRLIALAAATGKPVWSVSTVDSPDADPNSYTITGAPRVVKGKVIIGNAGGEYRARGYITAYDAGTGRKVWRFYTVPGEPGKTDGVAQKQVWSVPYETSWNSGVVSTAGNLVFQGTSRGEFAAFQADSGQRLWSTQTHTGILAPPITYEVNGEQYVVVELGWGGAFGLAAGRLAHDAQVNEGNIPRVLAFKLNGTDTPPAPPAAPDLKLSPPPNKAGVQVVAEGKLHYHTYCGVCHGDSAFSGGVLPDLRHSAALSDSHVWQSIVHDGVLSAGGMVSFGGQLSAEEIETIRAYVIYRANETRTP